MKSPQLRFINQRLAHDFVMPRLSVSALVMTVITTALCAWAALDAGSLVGWLILTMKSSGIAIAGIGIALYALRVRYLEDCLFRLIDTAQERGYNPSMPPFVYELFDDSVRELRWKRMHFAIVATILGVAVYCLSARELIVFFSAAAMLLAIILGGAFGGLVGWLIFAVSLVAAVSSWSAAAKVHGTFTGTLYQATYWFFALLTAFPLISILRGKRSNDGEALLNVLHGTQHGFVIGTLCGVGFSRAAEITQSAEEGYGTASADRDPEAQAGAIARGQVADSDALVAQLNAQE